MGKFKQRVAKWGPWSWAIAFVFVFVTLIIVAKVTDGITKRVTATVTDSVIGGVQEVLLFSCQDCESNVYGVKGLCLRSRPSELAFCEERYRRGFAFEDFQASDCGLCGENDNGEQGLCLKAEDLVNCEDNLEGVDELRNNLMGTAGFLQQLGMSLETATGPLADASDNDLGKWLLYVAIAGFVFGFLRKTKVI